MSWRRPLVRVVTSCAAVLAAGNLVILGASAVAQAIAPERPVAVPDEVRRIGNFQAIDEAVWRGSAPESDEYRALAEAGVTTIVDLRAEHDVEVPHELLDDLGVTLVSIPIRDGQTPTRDQVQRFLDAVAASDGTVYVHCGAGVGRAGTMAAAYQVSRGAGGWDAVRANLAVGPPSLEQLAFAASLDAGEPSERPNVAVVALSRALDAPRRIWHVLGL